MMGDLASLDRYGYGKLGVPVGAPPPEEASPPVLPDWAPLAMQRDTFVPSRATGMTPWKRADIEGAQRAEPRHPTDLDPATNKWLAENVVDAVVPTEPWEFGLMAATGGTGKLVAKVGGKALQMGALAAGVYGSNVDPAEARWIKYPFNNIAVGDTLSNLSKLNRHIPTKDIAEKKLQPHDIPVGSWLTPLVGDRSRSGGLVTHIGEQELRDPVWTQGGFQFTPEWSDKGVVWGSDRAPTTTINNRIKDFQHRRGEPDVYGVFTPMAPQAVDASHHMSDAVSQMIPLQRDKIAKTAVEQFNERMPEGFIGLMDPRLKEFLRGQSMTYRNNFIKAMNTKAARDAGFPDIEQARLAVTHPDLIDTPSYAGGQSIAKMSGYASHGFRGGGAAPHYTYPSKLHGEYSGGFERALPKEMLWRDLMTKINARDPSAAGKIWLTGLKGEDFGQRVDAQWQDTAAEYFRRMQRGD